MRSVGAARPGLFVGVFAVLAASQATAGDQVLRGEAPAWVTSSTETAAAPPATGGEAVRFLLFDDQFHAEPEGGSNYLHYRAKVLSPQALPLVGSVSLNWNPIYEDVTIHQVTIIRDGETIDVLADQSFQTVRREQNLEQAMLDGRLTAVLQPAGLRVGDVLDVAYTLVSRDPIAAGHPEQFINLNLPVTIDHVRYRVSWPSTLPVQVRAENSWTPLPVRRRDGQSSVEVQLDGVQPLIVPSDLPVRLRSPRRLEVSGYRDWSEIAANLKPLYDTARQLKPDSPLQAEIERIRALSDDPAVRAAAALRLVQDQVRYVALMMGSGALTPASADETWQRRFGDCKAKTALLLALLDGLGIEAAPAAVSIQNGDGMNARLPMVSAFDHVLVRARIDGQTYWLDGTRSGDRKLADIAVPGFRWALPLTGPEAKLEPLEVQPRTLLDSDTTVAIDASGGLYAPAPVTGVATMRGDGAALLGGQLAMVSAMQKDQGLRGLWNAQIGKLTITEVGSSYDVETNILSLTMKGTVTLDWPATGLIPPFSTYTPITAEERPDGPFKDAPYQINHPAWSRQTMTLKLPGNGEGFRISGGEIDRTELGFALRRAVTLSGDTATVEISLRSLTSEITAAEAATARAAEDARPWNPPRIFPGSYKPSNADRAALAADAPTTAGGWLDRAFALSKMGDRAGALEAAGHAVDLDPASSSAWANRGVYRFWMGDKEGAAADLDKAVDIDPSEPVAMNGNALLAMSDNRYDDAVIELSRVLRQKPGDDFALRNRAQAYVELEQYDRALRDLDTLIAAQPADVSLKLRRIAVLGFAQRKDEAETEMDALAAASPDEGRVLLNQAALKLERGKAEAAAEILDRALPLYPDRPEAVLIYRAEASAELGRTDRFAEDLKTIRDAHPAEADQLNSLCWTAGKAGLLLDQALKDCDAALALSPTSAAIMDSRARVLLQQNNLEAAVAAYDAALERSPQLPASLYGRGLARVALGRVEEGEADKAKALSLAPEVVNSFKHWSPPASPAP
jgi:tetratricopeptide (TPR) repeat protein/transglutaminase-like putative cysteine protease